MNTSKPIQFANLQAQYDAYKQDIDNAIQATLHSGKFIMGPEVKALEQALCQSTGAKHAIACANGTDALTLALMAIDTQPGDEIITTPFTFIATAEAISLLKAKVVFVDIDPLSFNIDPSLIAEKITSKTKAILPVSLYGQPADMDEINSIAEEHSKKLGHKIHVIEDAAQSFGATYKNKQSCNLSSIACTSFFPAKPLGCYGDGGAIFTNDDDIAKKLASLRVHGQEKRYRHNLIGINSRLDTLQAAILLAKLPHYAHEVAERDRIAKQYSEQLAASAITTPHTKEDRTSVFAQYTVRVANRDSIREKLSEKGIPTAVHYPTPLHLQPCFSNLGYKQGDFPHAEQAAGEVLSLPMSAFLTDEEQTYICETLSSIYSTCAQTEGSLENAS